MVRVEIGKKWIRQGFAQRRKYGLETRPKCCLSIEEYA